MTAAHTRTPKKRSLRRAATIATADPGAVVAGPETRLRSSSTTSTIVRHELPRRFDEHGNRKPDSMGDELAERLQDLLSGRASAGSFFKSIAGTLTQEEDREGRRPSRRRRASD